jgi:hypothetical protein
MRRKLLLAARSFLFACCPIGAAQGATDVMVTKVAPGVVCRNAQGNPVAGNLPQTPFRAEAATFDRIRIKDRDCYLNPGEYSIVPEAAQAAPCPPGQIARQSAKVTGTRAGADLQFCNQ